MREFSFPAFICSRALDLAMDEATLVNALTLSLSPDKTQREQAEQLLYTVGVV